LAKVNNVKFLLSHLLTDSASRDPGQAALRFQGESMTYAELDERSNQLATALKKLGAEPGDRVGIYLHKSFSSVVAVFGILKASAVYVPLDPGAPPSRLAYITRDCDIRILIVDADTIEGCLEIDNEDGNADTLVLLSEPGSTLEALGDLGTRVTVFSTTDLNVLPADEPPPLNRIEKDLAYILYTSGSTGVPKGVMISHQAIFAFLDWCQDVFHLESHDRVTSHAPLHFDLSTFDIYATIAAGATVVLVPEKLSVFPVRLVKLLQEERITITYLVPSVLTLMVNYGGLDQHDLGALRLVLFAGEVFPIKFLRKLAELIPQPDYYNLYGPTETNVCTFYKVESSDLGHDRTVPVPIGRACDNAEVFAVDIDGNQVLEPGKEGELWVRGNCVASGYWGDPDKTALGFVENPFQTHFREIAYRTGDIVTRAPDRTNWIYIGRRDHMVKSRGYRIELGEIESTIYGHASVKEAAAVAIPDEVIGNRIKAFIVPLPGHNLAISDVANHCKKRLASYMVPDEIELLDALPKTSTGKLDRPQLVRYSQNSSVKQGGTD